MIKPGLCYSTTKTLKLKKRRAKVKKLKASIKDYAYIALCLLVLGGILSHFEVRIVPRGIVEAKTIERVGIPVVKEVVKTQEVKVTQPDLRISKLRKFLESKNSPLAPYSELIVSQADVNAIDWTKIIAIACMESSCGLALPDGSHNAWGLGGSRFMYFNTWEEGIDYVSSLLGNQYKKNEYQAIKANYCPSSDNCNPNWAAIVASSSKEILAIEN